MKARKQKFINFTRDEEINIPSIDKQHFNMSRLINKISDGVESKNQPEINRTLTALLNLLEKHFLLEEKLMKDTKFPGYISHKLEHDRFYEKIKNISSNYQKNNSILDSKLLIEIRNWFFNHIELSDKKCGEHFVAIGIK